MNTKKCIQITQNPSVALNFYEPAIGQLIIWGNAKVLSSLLHTKALLPYWHALPQEVCKIYKTSDDFAAIVINHFQYE